MISKHLHYLSRSVGLAALGGLSPDLALADPGLGSLAGLQALFIGLLIIAGIVLFLVIPGLVAAYRTKRRGESFTKVQKTALGFGITLTVFLFPIVPMMLGAPRMGFWSYALLILYLGLASLTILCFVDNRKVVLSAAALILLGVIFRGVAIASFG